jgi:uncharacterized protein (UPF0276 family)
VQESVAEENSVSTITGCGLGLRSEFLFDISPEGFMPSWWEVTPENWIDMPYLFREKFEEVLSYRPAVAHGLSLSIGSFEQSDPRFLKKLKSFLDRYNIKYYSEHISFSHFENRQSYELLPLPLTKKMLQVMVDNIKRASDVLGRRLAFENATYYHVFEESELSEVDFINELLEQSDSKLLLDVNNVYVNSINHRFDAKEFIDKINHSRVAYIHMAGHFNDEQRGMLIDTHGTAITQPNWDLLRYTLQQCHRPAMIERDNNIPPLDELREEYEKLEDIYYATQHS